MRLALIAFTARGGELAQSLAEGLAAAGHSCALSGGGRAARALGLPDCGSLSDWTARVFAQTDGLIFVGACGIAVRAIAPYVRDKFHDPAVVAVDEGGACVVPLLSGHVGGANDLARQVAALTSGTAVVSTATDVNGLFAVDQWAARRGWTLSDRNLAKELSAALLAGEPVGFASDLPVEGVLPPGLTEGPAEVGLCVTWKEARAPFPATLRVYPRVLTVGIGCRRGVTAETLARAVDRALSGAGLAAEAVAGAASIDRKADEPGLLRLCRDRGWPLVTYPAETLARVEGNFTPSPFVQNVVGVDNVCERAAVCGGGTLLLPKQAGEGVTVAVALRPLRVTFSEE